MFDTTILVTLYDGLNTWVNFYLAQHHSMNAIFGSGKYTSASVCHVKNHMCFTLG